VWVVVALLVAGLVVLALLLLPKLISSADNGRQGRLGADTAPAAALIQERPAEHRGAPDAYGLQPEATGGQA
jgi:hypothetical protein